METCKHDHGHKIITNEMTRDQFSECCICGDTRTIHPLDKINPITKITPHQAYKILRNYKLTSKISRIYDYGKVSDALLTLIPSFEYPQWDWKTLNDALVYAREIHHIQSSYNQWTAKD